MIEMLKVNKWFGAFHALKDVDLSIGRGETPLGYKIGFTNRGIWDRYGVHEPIWAPVCSSPSTRSLSRRCSRPLLPAWRIPRI